MSKTEIVGGIGRQVLDSRGNPTVEAEVQLSGGVVCTAISPAALLRANMRHWNCATATKNATAAKVC